MRYADETRRKYGINVVQCFSLDAYGSMEQVLRHIEEVLQRAGLPIEMIDVEPAEGGIRFSIQLGDKEL